MRKNKFTIKTKDCCYIYVSKDLKKEILKVKKKLQMEENKKRGRKAETVTLSYASKILAKGGKKWF